MTNQFDVEAFRRELTRIGEAITFDARTVTAALSEGLAAFGIKAPEPTPEEPAETSLWQFAIRVPEGRAADVTRLLDEHGYEVYRAWPVSGDQEKAGS